MFSHLPREGSLSQNSSLEGANRLKSLLSERHRQPEGLAVRLSSAESNAQPGRLHV